MTNRNFFSRTATGCTCAALALIAGGGAMGQSGPDTAASVASSPARERHATVDDKMKPGIAASSHVGGIISRFSPESLYAGWRARQLLGKEAVAEDDQRTLGSVRDLIVDIQGNLTAVIIESGIVPGFPDDLMRVPWERVTASTENKSISVRVKAGSDGKTSLFGGKSIPVTSAHEFRLSELLGDYARLETGFGYGAVTDVVMSPKDRIYAVLVTRDAVGGGGTYAYPIGRLDTKWEPGLSYFGLPYIDPTQATAAGLKVDAEKFRENQG